jgi:hypothetical protein
MDVESITNAVFESNTLTVRRVREDAAQARHLDLYRQWFSLRRDIYQMQRFFSDDVAVLEILSDIKIRMDSVINSVVRQEFDAEIIRDVKSLINNMQYSISSFLDADVGSKRILSWLRKTENNIAEVESRVRFSV